MPGDDESRNSLLHSGRAVKIPNMPLLYRACLRSTLSHRSADVSLRPNLHTTYAWLCAAQDASPDAGVAGWYSLIRGWSASYPETTGYIIPSLLAYASACSEPDARARALRMADWEIEVQLPDGAVRSGVITAEIGPAVFNTGQALFGWLAAYRASGDDRYRAAAQRAAEWLLKNQDDDGAWRRNLSLRTTSKVQTYNVRAAWGLALAGRAFDESGWVKAAEKNFEWALTQQNRDGWFENNCFYENEIPLLHTIAYTLEGLLGAGETLGVERYMRAARCGVEPLVRICREGGRLKGRYARGWRGAASWRCLTGEAQLAVVLYRLSKYFDREEYLRVAHSLVNGLASIQDLDSSRPESKGAIAGSEPVWGGYCPLAYISWGAKFYLDALLMELFGVDVQEFHR